MEMKSTLEPQENYCYFGEANIVSIFCSTCYCAIVFHKLHIHFSLRMSYHAYTWYSAALVGRIEQKLALQIDSLKILFIYFQCFLFLQNLQNKCYREIENFLYNAYKMVRYKLNLFNEHSSKLQCVLYFIYFSLMHTWYGYKAFGWDASIKYLWLWFRFSMLSMFILSQ